MNLYFKEHAEANYFNQDLFSYAGISVDASSVITSKGTGKHSSCKLHLTQLKAFEGLLCVVFSLIAAGV